MLTLLKHREKLLRSIILTAVAKFIQLTTKSIQKHELAFPILKT